MATLSELTIYQADALRLQQEKNMKDVQLQQSYARMEQVNILGFSCSKFSNILFRVNHRVKNLNMNGNARMKSNKNVNSNEEFGKRFVIIYTEILMFNIIDCFLLQKERETEHFLLPGGVITQAEPRPQAYAPSDDADIQVARPYGAHAPFKPRYDR